MLINHSLCSICLATLHINESLYVAANTSNNVRFLTTVSANTGHFGCQSVAEERIEAMFILKIQMHVFQTSLNK